MRTPQFPDKLHCPHETTTKNLNRRGRKTRTAVTAAEVDFCAYFVLSGRGGATHCSECREFSQFFESSKSENRTSRGTQQRTESF
jgi:hypothetical protein